MADLDDFFAKKDRKRSKQAKKMAAADEPTSKRADEPRRDRERDAGGRGRDEGGREVSSDQPPPPSSMEEDEWREVEVAKKADYSGLKLQHLAPGQEGFASSEGGNSGTTITTNEQKIKGPWNKQQEQAEVKVEDKELPVPSEVILPPPPTSKTYVPPLLRNRPPGSSSDTPLRYNRYGKPLAPDINNEEFFPVLGESRKGGHHSSGVAGGGGQWSEASRGVPPSSRMPPSQVSLGNRYTSLTHDS